MRIYRFLNIKDNFLINNILRIIPKAQVIKLINSNLYDLKEGKIELNFNTLEHKFVSICASYPHL